MVLDIQDLQDYLRDAFFVFAESLEASFDFGTASLRNAPIPAGFGANISKLLLAITNKWKDNRRVSADQILTELSYMVASCIMLDIVRHKNKGMFVVLCTFSPFPGYAPYYLTWGNELRKQEPHWRFSPSILASWATSWSASTMSNGPAS